ncbi:hypothetical protein CDL15_Pgr023048 [Punica granatum]|uniref:Zinc finger CCCH domain-containing protein 13 n=1 Tax=Punica granatum TaxID=22663 RepID=A0A218X4L8_PUNGR|nr:hypothetical protein CDL15_Pgr023048 [Punica granatum]
MPRSSRHKSSKHSSRDARDFSDSDDESGSRDRRGGGEDGGARVSKDSGFSEKRRVESRDSKDVYGSGNGESVEDHGSSKRRKEKLSDGVSDRWNGGDDEGSNRAKSSSESKSRRRDDEGDDSRRSGKSERHRESSRKEGRESERKEREGKAEKMDEKQEIATDSRAAAISETENISERRTRKRRESFDDGGKYQYDIEDNKDRHAYSGDDATRGGKQKDEKLRDERHRDKYRDEVDKDSKNRYEKQKDDYTAKDRNGSRSSEKYLRDEKDNAETRSKKSKPHDTDRDVEPSRDRDRNRDRERDRDRDRDSDRDRERDHDHDPDWDRDRDGDRDRDREWVQDRERDRASVREKERERDWEHGKERDRDQERDRDHDRDRDRDYDDRSIRYKDHRGKKRSPDDRDDYYDKLRESKVRTSNMEKRSLSSTRGEADDRGRSQPRQVHLENFPASSRSRTSPASSSHGGIDECRHDKEEDPKYRDSSKEMRSRAISPRESAGFSGPADRGSKYSPFDKHNKLEDGHFGEFSAERSSGSKASPRGLTERSPSSTSLDRSRHTSRQGVRRNLDSEETGRRSGGSIDGRDYPVAEGRLSREMSMGRPAVDESSQADSSFNSKSGPGNSCLIPPQPPRRSNDANLGRGHGNNWRGVSNWSSPLSNGFIPFQHGPPHGNFPAMMPHFPAPPLFSVRPPMDINQSGLPYHLADADRFPGHLRPIGWQNMIDASGHPRFHGWEGTGGLMREDPHLFQGPDWEQNRHLMNIRGWETNSDLWKGQNGDLSADLPSASKKEEHPVQLPADDIDPKGHGFTGGDSHHPKKVQSRISGAEQEVPSLEREIVKSLAPKTEIDVGTDSSKSTEVDTFAQLSCAYLSKLDLSAELADPELYKRCLTLLGGEQASTGDDNPGVHTNFEGHGKVIKVISDGSLRVSVFPAIDDSVFQKAINHYRKQRLEPWSSVPLVNLGSLGKDSSINGEKVDEQDHVMSGQKKDEVSQDVDGEVPDLPIMADEMKVETLIASSPAERKTEECPMICSDKECLVIPGDREEVPPSTDAHCQNESEGPVDGAVQLVGDDEVLIDARADSGNTAVSPPLVVDDGSCDEGLQEAVMPNESKMANLSRIHQSPESTH